MFCISLLFTSWHPTSSWIPLRYPKETEVTDEHGVRALRWKTERAPQWNTVCAMYVVLMAINGYLVDPVDPQHGQFSWKMMNITIYFISG